jgi:hypothetical protein
MRVIVVSQRQAAPPRRTRPPSRFLIGYHRPVQRDAGLVRCFDDSQVGIAATL